METHLCVGTGQQPPAVPTRSVSQTGGQAECAGTGISGVPGAGDTPGTRTHPGSSPGRSGGESSRGGAVGGQVLLASQSPASNRNRTSKYERGHTKDQSDDLKHGV